MWLFTRYGFYSIACARKQDGSLDTDSLVVRARCREHLCDLRERLPAIASAPIIETPEADYRYQIVVPKRVWAAVLFDLAAEQVWSNFKAEVAAHQGDAGQAYVAALHDVWARMNRLQAVPPPNGRVVRNAAGVIMNAEELSAADLANERVLCPACGQKVFAVWPEGWDGHAGWACTIGGATPERRKANYKRRFRPVSMRECALRSGATCVTLYFRKMRPSTPRQPRFLVLPSEGLVVSLSWAYHRPVAMAGSHNTSSLDPKGVAELEP